MSTESVIKPKTFISYSWTTPEHVDRVLELAKRLMSDGVDVVIDKWDLAEGHDVNAFMEKMVSDPTVTKVVIISDRSYAEKADKREKGVGKETLIISAEVYEKAEQKRFIPVAFEFDSSGACLPRYLKGRMYIDMSSPERETENYEVLIRALYEKPLHVKPELGAAPGFLLETHPPASKTRGKLLSVEIGLRQEKPYAAALVDDYFREFESALEGFQIEHNGETPIDERALAAATNFIPYRDEFVRLINVLATYSDHDSTYQRIFEFFESAIRFFSPPPGVTQWDTRWYQHYDFMIGELFMHTIGTLLRRKRFSGAGLFMAQEYRNVRDTSTKEWESFEVFTPYVGVFDQERNARLKSNKVSLSADILRQRATGKSITADELMQVDLVLLLGSMLHRDRTSRVWFPYSLLYEKSGGRAMELFGRAESKRHFGDLKQLYRIASKDEFVTAIVTAGKELRWNGSIFVPNSMSTIDYANLANLAKLDSRA